MKFLVIADIHIGSRPDMKSYYDNELKWFLDLVLEKDPDIVVIAGDLFDKKIMKDSEFDHYANLFVNNLAKISKKLLVLRGTFSHDYNQLNSYSYLFLENKNCHLFNTVQKFNYKNCEFLMIPEEYEDNKEEYYKDYIFNDYSKYDMVFGHGMFTFAGGYPMESGKNNHIVFESKDFKDKVYGSVVFGHIHIRNRKDNCQYVGSFSRDSFGEEELKGVLFIDYDEKKKVIIKEEFIENKNAPIYKTINARDLRDENVFEDVNKHVKEVFKLRIVIDSDITESKYNNLKSMTYENHNIVIQKKMKGLNKREEDDKNKELDEKRKERKSKLDKYKDLDFFEITKAIAKDKYNENYTTPEIREYLV